MIIGLIITAVIAALFFGLLILLASKIVLGQAVEYSDAFKASLAACVPIALVQWGLEGIMVPEGVVYYLVSWGIIFVIWVLALMIMIGLELRQALLIALIFVILWWVVRFVFAALLVAGMTMGNAGA